MVKDHINSLGNQFKDKQQIIDGLVNPNSWQCSYKFVNRNYQEQKLVDKVKGLTISTNDIVKGATKL